MLRRRKRMRLLNRRKNSQRIPRKRIGVSPRRDRTMKKHQLNKKRIPKRRNLRKLRKLMMKHLSKNLYTKRKLRKRERLKRRLRRSNKRKKNLMLKRRNLRKRRKVVRTQNKSEHP
jgi:hypothetical protein